MRTLTALTLALPLLFTVATADAATHERHRRHQTAQAGQKHPTADAAKAPAHDTKAPATK